MPRNVIAEGFVLAAAAFAMGGCLGPEQADDGEDAAVHGALTRHGAEVQIGSSYRTCAVDADCVLIDSGCDGCCEQDAITAEQREGYLAELDQVCADYQGASFCNCAYAPVEARCFEAQCAAVDSDKPSTLDPYALTEENSEVIVSDAYLACTEQTECVVVDSGCGCCQYVAIGSDLVDVYSNYVAFICPGEERPVCDCQEQPMEALCVADRCQLHGL